MNRVWDYVGFVIWFVGLGYIVLWLLGMADHPMLSPALHAVGVLSAAFLAVRLADAGAQIEARVRRSRSGRCCPRA